MIGLLASQCSVLGERFATGINQNYVVDRAIPTVAYNLITSNGDRFVDNLANGLIAIDFPTGHLLTSNGDVIVDSSGNTFQYASLI